MPAIMQMQNRKNFTVVWKEVDAGYFSVFRTWNGLGFLATARGISDKAGVTDAAAIDNMGSRNRGTTRINSNEWKAGRKGYWLSLEGHCFG